MQPSTLRQMVSAIQKLGEGRYYSSGPNVTPIPLKNPFFYETDDPIFPSDHREFAEEFLVGCGPLRPDGSIVYPSIRKMRKYMPRGMRAGSDASIRSWYRKIRAAYLILKGGADAYRDEEIWRPPPGFSLSEAEAGFVRNEIIRRRLLPRDEEIFQWLYPMGEWDERAAMDYAEVEEEEDWPIWRQYVSTLLPFVLKPDRAFVLDPAYVCDFISPWHFFERIEGFGDWVYVDPPTAGYQSILSVDLDVEPDAHLLTMMETERRTQIQRAVDRHERAVTQFTPMAGREPYQNKRSYNSPQFYKLTLMDVGVNVQLLGSSPPVPLLAVGNLLQYLYAALVKTTPFLRRKSFNAASMRIQIIGLRKADIDDVDADLVEYYINQGYLRYSQETLEDILRRMRRSVRRDMQRGYDSGDYNAQQEFFIEVLAGAGECDEDATSMRFDYDERGYLVHVGDLFELQRFIIQTPVMMLHNRTLYSTFKAWVQDRLRGPPDENPFDAGFQSRILTAFGIAAYIYLYQSSGAVRGVDWIPSSSLDEFHAHAAHAEASIE